MPVATSIGEDGAILHIVGIPPEKLPPVTKRDLEQAWEAARAGASGAPYRAFRFATAGASIDLLLNDTDAAAWAGALERIVDLSTAHGISVCLRLLALINVMAGAVKLRRFFSLAPGGAEIHPALLQAAALAPLNDAAGFDETALLALLPPA